MYTILKIKDNEYKLRLRTIDIINIERRLGKSLIDVFLNLGNALEKDNMTFLPLEDMAIILLEAMQKFNHSIKQDKVYDLIDEYLSEGNSLIELLPIIVDVLQTSGILGKNEKVESDSDDEGK